MEPSFRLIQLQVNRSFVYKLEPLGLHTRWHYHPEIELMFVIEGNTSAIFGDNFQEFEEGELVILGANFPHVLQENKAFVSQFPHLQPFGLVIQFLEGFMGNDFLEKPELISIKEMLKRAKRGIKFGKSVVRKVSRSLIEMNQQNNPRKLLTLLDVLLELSVTEDYEYMTMAGYSYDFTYDEGRMQKVNEYVYKHFDQKITNADAASIANMTESSFCRYFKSRTLKQFSQFLNEVRIAHACKLLRNNEPSTMAATESGYNNQAYFNKQFLKIMKMTPSEYKKKKRF